MDLNKLLDRALEALSTAFDRYDTMIGNERDEALDDDPRITEEKEINDTIEYLKEHKRIHEARPLKFDYTQAEPLSKELTEDLETMCWGLMENEMESSKFRDPWQHCDDSAWYQAVITLTEGLECDGVKLMWQDGMLPESFEEHSAEMSDSQLHALTRDCLYYLYELRSSPRPTTT